MKNTITTTRKKRTRKLSLTRKIAAVRESTVVFFGGKSDPEVQSSIRKAKATGRKTELQVRPSFDTGTGLCGKHLCSCKTVCSNEYAATVPGAFPGDQGPTMGMAY